MPWDDTCSPLFWEQWEIEEGQEHGEDWKKLMTSAVKDGVLKECAKELDSPIEQCIFKENKEKCELCEPWINF